jgi:hypothetical protein
MFEQAMVNAIGTPSGSPDAAHEHAATVGRPRELQGCFQGTVKSNV